LSTTHFAERLHETVAGKSARRTLRLDAIVHHLGVALGGRPTASLTRRLMLPVSKDTLLRVVCRHASRDRSPCTSSASTTGRGSAVSVAAASSAISNGDVSSISSRIANPPQWRLGCRAILKFASSRATAAADMAKLQPEPHRDGYLRREEAYGIIRALAKTATPIKEIVRRTGRSRKLVREIVRGGGGDVFRCRSNVLEPHVAWLDAEWSADCRNGAELWRWLQKTVGFRGSLRVVAEWATRRRRAESAGSETLRKPPPARVLSRLLSSERDHLTKVSGVLTARFEGPRPAR
jgi:transposase